MSLDRAAFSELLVSLRRQHDPPLDQGEAAKLIGMSLRHYGRLERGQADATISTVRQIAGAYGVDPTLLTVNGNERLTATSQAPTLADFARLEAKLDQLLEHFDIHTGADLLEMPDELAELLRTPPSPRRARRRTGAGD